MMTVKVIGNQERRRKEEHVLAQGQLKTVMRPSTQGPAQRLKNQRRRVENRHIVDHGHLIVGEGRPGHGGQAVTDMLLVEEGHIQGHLIIVLVEDPEAGRGVLIDDNLLQVICAHEDQDLEAGDQGHILEKGDQGQETGGQGQDHMIEQVPEDCHLRQAAMCHQSAS